MPCIFSTFEEAELAPKKITKSQTWTSSLDFEKKNKNQHKHVASLSAPVQQGRTTSKFATNFFTYYGREHEKGTRVTHSDAKVHNSFCSTLSCLH